MTDAQPTPIKHYCCITGAMVETFNHDGNAAGDYVSAEDHKRLLAQRDAELREANARAAEEKSIVDRIWAMFGSPDYKELRGRSIYDLIQSQSYWPTKWKEERIASIRASERAAALTVHVEALTRHAEAMALSIGAFHGTNGGPMAEARLAYNQWRKAEQAGRDAEEEEYDCPIHGKLGGINYCPRC